MQAATPPVIGGGSRRIQPFRMSRVPVTNMLYKFFVDAEKYDAPAHWDKGQIPLGLEHHPVVYVSWWDAQAFCQWAGVHLPTATEWQLAAAGPYGFLYPWGNLAPDPALCNFNCHVGHTTPVDQYPNGVSPFGLLDMAGNVWEWTDSIYEPPGMGQNGAGAKHVDASRILCGGSFYDGADQLKCLAYNWTHPQTTDNMIGFRVVLPIDH